MDKTAETLKAYASYILATSNDEVGMVRIGANAFQDQDTKEIIWVFEFNGVGTLYEGVTPMGREVLVAIADDDFEPLKSWMINDVGIIAAGLLAQGLDLPDTIELVIGEWTNSQPVKSSAKATAALRKMADSMKKEFNAMVAMTTGLSAHIPVGEA